MTVKFFGYFREITGSRAIQIESEQFGTVGDVLQDVVKRYPDIRDKLFDGKRVMPFVKVLVNGLAIEVLDGLETKVKAGDAVAIFPPVGGG
ncbi:MAG: MoaD family protein [Thermoplasmata archaeon]|nr:MoaD family protein [Thermoplasmata archaeon]